MGGAGLGELEDNHEVHNTSHKSNVLGSRYTTSRENLQYIFTLL